MTRNIQVMQLMHSQPHDLTKTLNSHGNAPIPRGAGVTVTSKTWGEGIERFERHASNRLSPARLSQIFKDQWFNSFLLVTLLMFCTKKHGDPMRMEWGLWSLGTRQLSCFQLGYTDCIRAWWAGPGTLDAQDTVFHCRSPPLIHVPRPPGDAWN